MGKERAHWSLVKVIQIPEVDISENEGVEGGAVFEEEREPVTLEAALVDLEGRDNKGGMVPVVLEESSMAAVAKVRELHRPEPWGPLNHKLSQSTCILVPKLTELNCHITRSQGHMSEKN